MGRKYFSTSCMVIWIIQTSFSIRDCSTYLFIFSWPSKRVVSWSSLDWDRSHWKQVDLVLGTLFDALIHAMNVSLLVQHLVSVNVLITSLIVTLILFLMVIYNPKLAWANPESKIPDWIKLRMRPLSDDERQEWKSMEILQNKGD